MCNKPSVAVKNTSASSNTGNFTEYSLSVHDEVLPESSDDGNISSEIPEHLKDKLEPTAVDGSDEDLQLSQTDFNAAVGLGEADPVYEKFLARITKGNI